mgnify:FL=1
MTVKTYWSIITPRNFHPGTMSTAENTVWYLMYLDWTFWALISFCQGSISSCALHSSQYPTPQQVVLLYHWMLSYAAHVYVPNSFYSLYSFNLSTPRDESVLHALLSASPIQLLFFTQLAISCISHYHSCITIPNSSQCWCTAWLSALTCAGNPNINHSMMNMDTWSYGYMDLSVYKILDLSAQSV